MFLTMIMSRHHPLFEQRLNKLSRLYESGAISREEYEARRREIIEEI